MLARVFSPKTRKILGIFFLLLGLSWGYVVAQNDIWEQGSFFQEVLWKVQNAQNEGSALVGAKASKKIEMCMDTLTAGQFKLVSENLPEELKTVFEVTSLLEKECLWVFRAAYKDITKDGINEIFLNTAGAGCASCHARRLLILDGASYATLFDESVDQGSFIFDGDADFKTKEAVRLSNESYCCPSKAIIRDYYFDKRPYLQDLQVREF
ncbi:hypothetical protein GF360_00985 [candidate division WWE3 bacterium]|nr:hypothetical protein [candidate division WWE3 bacterium]